MEWKKWEGRVVDQGFHLREFLSGSAYWATFLTEYGPGPRQDAIIKLFPADLATATAWCSRREDASRLSHPGLISIFQFGTFQFDGENFVYAVMEPTEEDLSQVIPIRPLAPPEARDMITAVLDTLAYLHIEGFVHGGLTPAKIMAAGDRVKISSDGLLRIGEPSDNLLEQNVYGPPEGRAGLTPAGDVWSLGMTLVEVLTQHLPAWDTTGTHDPVIPESLEAPFLDIARRCLRSDPELRCSLAEVALALRTAAPEATSPSVVATPLITKTHVPRATQGRRYLLPIAGAILLIGAILTGARLMRSPSATPPGHPESSGRIAAQDQPGTVPPPPAQEAAPPSPDKTSDAPKPSPLGPRANNSADRLLTADGVDQYLPKVPPQILRTIRGKVNVRVRVRTDQSGAVVDAKLDSHSGSKYFDRVAVDAARRWRFRPARDAGHDVETTRRIRFEFRKNGCEAFWGQVTP